MKNAINWFEIPALDYPRAKTFYETVLDLKITNAPMPDMEYGMFPYDNDAEGVGGGIVKYEGYKPSADGPVIYLNAGEDLAPALARVEAAGGKVIMPKTDIGENGFMATLLDTEGNRVALHSWK